MNEFGYNFYSVRDRHCGKRVEDMVIISAALNAAGIQDADDAGIGLCPDGSSKALAELLLHVRNDRRKNVVRQSWVFLLFLAPDLIRNTEGQCDDNQRRDHISGKIHSFPAGTGRKENGVGGILEFLDNHLQIFVANQDGKGKSIGLEGVPHFSHQPV